jgi:hypothetical protein
MDQPKSNSEADSRLFQSRSVTPLATLLGLMICGLFIPAIQAFNKTGKQHSAHPILGVILLVVAVLLLSWCIGVVARVGVRTSDIGIIVQNRFRRYRVSWADIESFSFNSSSSTLSVPETLTDSNLVPYTILKNGKKIPMVGLSAVRNMGKKSKQNVQVILDELERMRTSASDQV